MIVKSNFLQILITITKLLPKKPANGKNNEIQAQEWGSEPDAVNSRIKSNSVPQPYLQPTKLNQGLTLA